MKLLSFSVLALCCSLSLVACGDDTGGTGGTSGAGGGSGGSSPTSTTTGASTAETSSGSGGTGGESVTTGTSSVASTTATTTTGSTTTGSGGGSACDGEGFDRVSEDAGGIQDTFLYFALSSEAAPSDDLSFEIYSDIGTPGDRAINDENYAVCDPCVLLRLGCDENFANCSQKFLANTGTISISSFEGTFTGELQGVELVEVEIDDQANSTPVPGGDVWCLDGYTFDATIQ